MNELKLQRCRDLCELHYGQFQPDKGVKHRVKKRRQYTKDNESTLEELKGLLHELYWKEEYGFNLTSRQLGFSPTVLRTLFKFLDFKFRRGRNVVTDRVRSLRSDRAKMSMKQYGFSDKQPKTFHSPRGIQGWYYSTNTQKHIWLRSSWEYIYAKWLDSHDIIFKVEERQFNLSGGKRYTPDFFIYENDNLVGIVEIKGYWKDRIWKPQELQSQVIIPVSTIVDIKPYIENNVSLEMERRRWKKERLSTEQLNRLRLLK
jgi:hypothetical protein